MFGEPRAVSDADCVRKAVAGDRWAQWDVRGISKGLIDIGLPWMYKHL